MGCKVIITEMVPTYLISSIPPPPPPPLRTLNSVPQAERKQRKESVLTDYGNNVSEHTYFPRSQQKTFVTLWQLVPVHLVKYEPTRSKISLWVWCLNIFWSF